MSHNVAYFTRVKLLISTDSFLSSSEALGAALKTVNRASGTSGVESGRLDAVLVLRNGRVQIFDGDFHHCLQLATRTVRIKTVDISLPHTGMSQQINDIDILYVREHTAAGTGPAVTKQENNLIVLNFPFGLAD